MEAQVQVQSKVETLTPELCKSMLSSNKHNRKINQNMVRLYTKQMINGNWRVNGEAIIIADNKDLLDGQHRLLACIESNVPLVTMVVRDIPRDSFMTLDTGKSRNGADILTINGMSSGLAKICSAAAGMAIPVELFGTYYMGSHHSHATTPEKRVEYINKNPRLVEIAEKVLLNNRINRPINSSQATFLWFLMEKKEPVKTEDFFDGFLSGADLSEKDVRLGLRQKLFQQKTKVLKWDKNSRLGAVIRTWSWYCRESTPTNTYNLFKYLKEAVSLIVPEKHQTK